MWTTSVSRLSFLWGLGWVLCGRNKVPIFLKSKLSYINAKDEISAKCVAQMQLQMFLSNRKSCLFCVAEPNFEMSCKVTIREVKFDPTLLNDLIVKATNFWNSAIWNALQCK